MESHLLAALRIEKEAGESFVQNRAKRFAKRSEQDSIDHGSNTKTKILIADISCSLVSSVTGNGEDPTNDKQP